MNKSLKLFIFIFLILANIVLFWAFWAFFLNEKLAQVREVNNIYSTDQVCFKEHCFDVEIADTPEKRGQGLMFREYLSENEGMMFVFEKEDIYSFWMKNTLIPLDMIWIAESGEVVFIQESAQPCKQLICHSYEPDKKAKYVLEINGGTSREIGLSVGDIVSVNY